MSDFRVLVTGSRTWPDEGSVSMDLTMILTDLDPASRLIVVHGACPTGADRFASRWVMNAGLAREKNPAAVPVTIEERHPADWDACAQECRPGHRKTRRDGRAYCPTAGFRRNQAMADAGADLCLAFSIGGSPGTADMVRRAKAAGIPVEQVDR